MSNTTELFFAVGIMAILTAFTRFLPFLVFSGKDNEKPTPKTVRYLGGVLPAALMAMLVVYCLRDISFTTIGKWLPELLAGLLTAGLYAYKRNTLLAILGGSALYMILIQTVF